MKELVSSCTLAGTAQLEKGGAEMNTDIYLEISSDLHFPVDRRSLPSLLDNYDALAREDVTGMTWIGVEEVEPTRIVKRKYSGWESIIPGRYHATCFGGYRCGRGGCFYTELPGEKGKVAQLAQ